MNPLKQEPFLVIILILFLIIIGLTLYSHFKKSDEPFVPFLPTDLLTEQDITSRVYDPETGNILGNILQNQMNYETNNIKSLLAQSNELDIKTKALASQLEDTTRAYGEYPSSQPIQTIKSMNNNAILSAQNTSANKTLNSYQILVNDKCMTVLKDGQYDLEPCLSANAIGNAQKFSHYRVNNPTDARYGTGIMPNKTSSNTYPYSIFKSKITNQCLSIDDDGIRIMWCHPDDIRQKWYISPNSNTCETSIANI